MKKLGAKREMVIANLINEPRQVLNLLAVGREDADGSFPNLQTNFVLRKLRMAENRTENWRGGQLYELTIPRHCAVKLAKEIEKLLTVTEYGIKKNVSVDELKDGLNGKDKAARVSA